MIIYCLENTIKLVLTQVRPRKQLVENKQKGFAKHRYRTKLASKAITFSKQTEDKGISRRLVRHELPF